MQKVIEVKKISKSFSDIRALEEISFSVDKGEIAGFLGPNGAGKTTTMRILTCFIPPDDGTATVLGDNIFHNPLEIKKRIGYLPEHPPLYTGMTVMEYLLFVCSIKGCGTGLIKKTVSLCGLADVTGRLIANLSKGYKQRIGIAQALVNDPDLLVLDEPTIGLDPNQIVEIRQLIKNIGTEKTVLLSSHSLSEIQAICSKIVIINKGKIVADDSMQNLVEQYDVEGNVFKYKVECRHLPHGYKKILLALAGIISVQEAGENMFIAQTRKNMSDEIAVACISNDWGLMEIKKQQISLEDLFFRLTM